jgi:hypothetical protein
VGSSGSGKLGDYQNPKGDQCDNTIEADLEEVALAAYMTKHGKVPTVGTNVTLNATQHKGRYVVETSKTHESIGNLPTEFNYVILCLNQGYRYSGEVIAAHSGKAPAIEVHLVSIKP